MAQVSVFVLKLQNNKYYVGMVKEHKHLQSTIHKHLNKKIFTEWTKLNNPVKLSMAINNCVIEAVDICVLNI